MKIRWKTFKKLYMNWSRLQGFGIEKLMLNCAIRILKKNDNDATFYVKTLSNDGSLLIFLYVDDLLVTDGDEQELQKFKVKMEKQFDMSKLGEEKYFWELKVYHSSQKNFSISISMFWRFWKILECKVVNQFPHH